MAKRPDRLTAPYRTAIVVLGMHRSGTSALARIVNFLGAALPRHLVPASPSNPRGHWESAPLVALHEELLTSIESSWDDWRTPPLRWRDNDTSAKFGGRIQQTIDEEYGAAPLIVMKDPRMCRTLPYWLSVLEKTGIRTAPLIIVRNPLEVAESLRERDGLSFEKSMLLWLRHYLDAEFETRHLPRNIISLDVLLDDWRSLAAQTAGRIGLQWPRSIADAAQDVREFLDLELHNHRATMAELEAHTEVPSWVKSAYRALTILCDEPKAADPKRELDRVRQNFAESAKVFGVVAFAQTDALKQATIDVAAAMLRADGADQLRADLAQERAARSDLASKHQSLSERVRKLELDLTKTSERANKAEQAAADFETGLKQLRAETKDLPAIAEKNLKRAEAAEKNAASLVKDVAELERSRNELSQTLSRMSTDATDLRKMAENVSRRTEWIEAEMRKQATTTEKPKAELDAARAKVMSLSTELQAALANSMSLSKELAATKDKLHTHEKQAIQLIADAKRYQEALRISQQRLQELESEDRASQSELAELRVELAEAWSLNGRRFQDGSQAPSEPVLVIDHAELSDAQARAMRVEEDLRFERMHVQQLERRLNSWTGIASAALRKITRLGGKPAPIRRKPGGQHHMAPPPIASRS
jgi:hypothetical protein